MMDKVKIMIILLVISQTMYGQTNEEVYLMFNQQEEEGCHFTKEDIGRYKDISNVEKYQKIKSTLPNIEYRFYICKELFLNRKYKVDTCSYRLLNKIKISSLKELKKIVYDKNPLYPNKVFHKVFILEKINDSTILKYEVEWKYYVE